MNYIELISNLATIMTAVVAVIAYVTYRRDRCLRRKNLERYLEAEKVENHKPAHTAMHLMAKLGMTKEEIFRASFESSHIARKIQSNKETGLAEDIVFEYCDKSRESN